MTIKSMSDRTRDAVYEATRARGLTVGEWVDRALTKAATGPGMSVESRD